MAEKIRDDHFAGARAELIEIIYAVVTNLLCPVCSAHAKDYFQTVNLHTLHTKDQLRHALFAFHNDVNQKKHYPLFALEQLPAYRAARTAHVANAFLREFQNRHGGSPMLIADNMHRTALINTFKTYLTNNIHKFDP
jgi:hypothetical protein